VKIKVKDKLWVESEWVDKKKFVYKVFYRDTLKLITSDKTVAYNGYKEILEKVS
tara:strand:+ start:28 stop:189 length:162 start_codon:yes stop_codon:yes gene_type:complete